MASKFLSVIAITISIALPYNSFGQNDPNIKLKKDLQRYKERKDGGMVMIVVGSLLMVAGGVFEASQWNESFDSWASGDPEPEYSNAGIVMVCSGGALLGGGLPLAISGRRKYKELKNNHPEIVSMGIKTHPASIGVGVTARF